MIRVLISATSSASKARLVNRLRSLPQFELVDMPSHQILSSADLQPDVLLVEVDNDDEAAVAVDDPASGIPMILLVSGYSASPVDAIRQNAHAVLPSDLTDTQLAAAIEAVAAGLGVFMPDETQDPPRRFETDVPLRRPLEDLTPREIEILRAMADGLANKEIAARLAISENTVKFHVGSVMGKLGASSRTQAVMLGVRYGIVLI